MWLKHQNCWHIPHWGYNGYRGDEMTPKNYCYPDLDYPCGNQNLIKSKYSDVLIYLKKIQFLCFYLISQVLKIDEFTKASMWEIDRGPNFMDDFISFDHQTSGQSKISWFHSQQLWIRVIHYIFEHLSTIITETQENDFFLQNCYWNHTFHGLIRFYDQCR